MARRLLPARAGPGITAAVAGGLLHVAAVLGLPLVVASIVDDGLLGRDPDLLARQALLLMVIAAGIHLGRTGHELALIWLSGRGLIELWARLLEHIQLLPMTYFDRSLSGKTHALLVQDAPKVASQCFQIVGGAGLSLLQLVALVVLLSWSYGWMVSVVALLVPLYVILPAIISRRTRRAAKKAMDAGAEVSSRFHQSLAMSREIRIFSRERWNLEQSRSLFADRFRLKLHLAVLRSANRLNGILYFMITGAVYWVGGLQVIEGNLTVGRLVALVALLGFLEQPVNRLVSINAEIQATLASFDRLQPLWQEEIQPELGTATLEVPTGGLEIRFEHVTFCYPGKETAALEDVSFVIPAGSKAGVVGPSGAGKSTVIGLLLRLYEPQQGRILLSGQDIREVSFASLRDAMGVVLQDPVLLPASVNDNLRFGRLTATDEELRAAAQTANAHEFIETLPQGYESPIGERGAQLSGGQRQRIAIARAVVREPSVLIFDEATSALDSDSERTVHDSLKRAAQDKTLLFIAHRLSTMTEADLILVLDSGRLIARGHHRELLASCPAYENLYQLHQGDRSLRIVGAL